MSSGFHRLGANAGKVPGFSNRGIGGLVTIAAMKPVYVEGPDSAPQLSPKPPAVDATLLDSERSTAPAMGMVQARQSGFTGDQCTHCNSMRMKNNGHCLVCEDCGTSTGCS